MLIILLTKEIKVFPSLSPSQLRLHAIYSKGMRKMVIFTLGYFGKPTLGDLVFADK
jgi:hypothetical protein